MDTIVSPCSQRLQTVIQQNNIKALHKNIYPLIKVAAIIIMIVIIIIIIIIIIIVIIVVVVVIKFDDYDLVAVFEKTCEATEKNVKSHVFFWILKKKRKKRTGRPTQPVVSQAT